MIEKFIALSGLPRTGSTLLSSILNQNPEIHSEGNSAVCQLMSDMQWACRGKASEALIANYRFGTEEHLVSSIPQIYYKDISKPIIFDKCRSWTLSGNVEMLERYVEIPRVIVLQRPISEIVKSFVNLRIINNWVGDVEEGLLDDESEPIMRSLKGLLWAKKNNDGKFLFINYCDILNNTEKTINSIYSFCDIKPFKHDYTNISNNFQENDIMYGLIGQHDVRPTISQRVYDVVLSEKTKTKCAFLDKLMGD